MKFGKPWLEEEIRILKECLNPTIIEPGSMTTSPLGIQSTLATHGFKRSLEAVKRKIQRIGTIPRFKDPGRGPRQAFVTDGGGPRQTLPVETTGIRYRTGNLVLRSSITKFVMLNDVHVPHNIPLDNIFSFIKDFKPDYMLLVGDIINNDPFSHWDKKIPGRFKNMPQPKAYYEDCNRTFYRPLRKIVGDHCPIAHWIGNHEFWSNKAISEIPDGEGYWEVENNIEGIDFWIPSKGIANLGKLHFLHGDIIPGGYHHSQAMLSAFQRNVRYGHHHDIQESSFTSPIDVADRHTARSCGTLQNFNPGFMGNRPHRWQHAFTYGFVWPSGLFQDYTVKVINNSFWAEGKLYGSF